MSPSLLIAMSYNSLLMHPYYNILVTFINDLLILQWLPRNTISMKCDHSTKLCQTIGKLMVGPKKALFPLRKPVLWQLKIIWIPWLPCTHKESHYFGETPPSVQRSALDLFFWRFVPLAFFVLTSSTASILSEKRRIVLKSVWVAYTEIGFKWEAFSVIRLIVSSGPNPMLITQV